MTTSRPKFPGRLSFFLFVACFLLPSTPLLAQQPAPEPTPSPAPPQPAPGAPNPPPANPGQSPNPTAGSSPSSHLMRTWRRLSYTCEGDQKVDVDLHGSSARVAFKGRTYMMRQVDGGAAGGQKYSSGALAWWNKGQEGRMERNTPGEKNKPLASGCHLQSTGTAPAAADDKPAPASKP